MSKKLPVWQGMVFLCIVYGVGIAGVAFQPLNFPFESLTPINLLVTAAVLAYYHTEWSWSGSMALGVIGVAGFAIEWMGVTTGQPFGSYSYGTNLGPKILNVPPVIGLNWILLVYITHGMFARVSRFRWLRILLAATAMVVLDILIEPAAPRLDLWSWQGGHAPIQNFLAWWMIGILFQWIASRYIEIRNPLSWTVYLLFSLFFASCLILR